MSSSNQTPILSLNQYQGTDKPSYLDYNSDMAKIDNIANYIYPVGSIYMSANSTSPASLFGGEWEQIKDRFLLGVGDTFVNTNVTGGEIVHSLSMAEMPRHAHGLSYYIYHQSATNGSASLTSCAQTANWDGSITTYLAGGPGGSDGSVAPHNNMPPWFTVYIWKRVS